MSPTLLTYLMILLIWAEYVLERWLSQLNAKSWNQPVPKELSDLYTEEEYARARDYASDKRSLSLISSMLSTAFIIGLLLWGVFGAIQGQISTWTIHPVVQSLVFFAILGVGAGVLNLPFSLYQTFVIEAKYGFNRTTLSTFISDRAKGIVMGTVIGGVILTAVVLFYEWQAQWFWLYTWALLTAFSVFMAMFYTSWLVPMFNKLSPLEDGSLRDKLEALGAKTGFPLKEVAVLDGSKRSSKANAYFSGLGPRKMIVLFDTLIEQLSEAEIEAVMAHEIGHYHHRHVMKSMLVSSLHSGVMLFIIHLLEISRIS